LESLDIWTFCKVSPHHKIQYVKHQYFTTLII